jgi:hypothetical protein
VQELITVKIIRRRQDDAMQTEFQEDKKPEEECSLRHALRFEINVVFFLE